MLSIMRFLIQIAAFTEMDDAWEGSIVTDSDSLLRTLRQSPTSLDPLQPEWDLLIEIFQSLHKLPLVTLEFVKGHQDRNKSVENLPLLGQLNVEADAAAVSFQEMSVDGGTYVPMSTHTGAHLHLPTCTTLR